MHTSHTHSLTHTHTHGRTRVCTCMFVYRCIVLSPGDVVDVDVSEPALAAQSNERFHLLVPWEDHPTLTFERNAGNSRTESLMPPTLRCNGCDIVFERVNTQTHSASEGRMCSHHPPTYAPHSCGKRKANTRVVALASTQNYHFDLQ
jgi:hypothetical protein